MISFNKEYIIFMVCRQSNQKGEKTRWDRLYLHVYFLRIFFCFLNVGFLKT